MNTVQPIQVESKYTLALLRDLLRVNYRKHRLITMGVFIVCMPILTVFSQWDYKRSGNMSSFLPITLAGIAFFILMYVYCGFIYNQNTPIQKTIVTYTFNENEYTVYDLDGFTTNSYSNVHWVLETKRAFYLCVGPKKYNVVSKTGFLQGNQNELFDLLSRNFAIKKWFI